MKIPERQAQLDALTRKYLTPEEDPSRENGRHHQAATGALSDEDVIALCRKAKNAAKFADLFDAGDTDAYSGDDSSADLALVSLLAFYTQDEDQLDRIFSQSALYRPKKWGRRSDYRRRTIAKALDKLTERYTGRRDNSNYTNLTNRTNPITAERFNNTDLGNSARLVAHHGQDLRYCYPWSAWLIWDGRRWSLDESGEIHRRAKRTVREIYREAADAADDETRKALGKHAKASEAENRIQAMISLAKSEVPIMPAAMDANPWLLNVSNGTINLKTSELLEHRRDDLLTKLAPVVFDPEASAPTWAATLERVLPSAEVREFFKRLCGYAISGDVSEHVLPVLYGTGANGKSTILNALLEAAGEYGMQAAPDLLIAKRGGHPTEVADLFGMRVVASIEVEDGRRLAEALVKSLTGGDKVRARRMRQDFWQFDPTHTAFLCTNHKPEIRGTDAGIWRRIRLIPFTKPIPPAEQDKRLPEKLRAELPGILAWAVEGCLEWRRDGLKAPDEVRKATGNYRAEMDVIGAFLKDCCEEEPEHDVAAKDLYTRYKSWCDENGETTEKQRTFGSKLSERGYERYRGGVSGGHRWRGLTLCDVAICRGSDPTDLKMTINGSKNTRVERNDTLGSEGSEGSVDPTEEQRRRIAEQMRQGTAEGAARAAVLGNLDGWLDS